MNAKLTAKKHPSRNVTLALAAVLFASSLTAIGALGTGYGASALYNVQVFVATQKSLPNYNFYFSAYNLSGSLVATSQTPYPGAGFELPQGKYLFTVSAVSQVNYYCNLCMQPMTSGAAVGSSSAPTKSPDIAYPIYRPPAAEYGFQVEKVNGPDSFSIKTLNITDYPTTKATVGVRYTNGTAAVNASVSASIVGEWYYWWGPNSTVRMWGETDPAGKTVLVLPSAPAVVSAWKWDAVNLPESNKSAIANVGGEKVNVTVRWEPTYVGLAASGLLLPPDNAITLTLHYQPFNYWVMRADGKAAPSSGATVANAPSGTPTQAQQGNTGQYYLPSVIPPINSISSSIGGSPAEGGISWTSPLVEGAIAAAAIVAGTSAAVLLKRRQMP